MNAATNIRRSIMRFRLYEQAVRKEPECLGDVADFGIWGGSAPICARGGCNGKDCVVAPLIEANFKAKCRAASIEP